MYIFVQWDYDKLYIGIPTVLFVFNLILMPLYIIYDRGKYPASGYALRPVFCIIKIKKILLKMNIYLLIYCNW